MMTPAPGWRCWRWAVLACLLASSAGAAEKWTRLQADGVTVYSEVSADDAAGFMVGYLGFRHTFEVLFGRPDRPLAPVHVLLYRRQRSLGKIEGESPDALYVTTALTSMADGDVILALSMDSDRKEALRNIYEFDTISGLQRTGYFLPLWMEQGTGAELATLEMEKDTCVVGGVVDWMVGKLGNEDWLPWEKISTVRLNSTAYTKHDAFPLFAAQSWAMMRTVLQNDPAKARERFLALVEQVRRTPRADLAIAKVLQLDPAALTSAVKRQMRPGGKIVVPFERDQARARIKVDAAPEVEVDVTIADLILVHGNRAAAAAALQKAIDLAPDSPLVLEAMARREIKNGDRDRAAEYYRAAIAAGATNPRAFILSARQRLDDVTGSGGEPAGQGGVPASDALAELRQALKLNPGDGEAYVQLGRALYMSESLSPADLAELEPGFESRDYGPWVRYYHALLQLRLDQYAEAVASLRQLLQDTALADDKRRDLLRAFASQNFNLVKARVETLVHTKDFDGARSLLNQRLDPTEWDVIAEPVASLRKWVDMNVDLDALQQLESTGRPEELRKARRDFVARYPGERAAQQVQMLLDLESGAVK